jgi:predicted transcriptional regulator
VSGVVEQSVVEYVLSSSVRSDVLLAIESGTTGSDALIEVTDASESAVYNAFGALERRGVVRSTADGWQLTGSGQFVADAIRQNREACALLDDDYWQTHDIGELPRRFRLRLGDLAGAEVTRADDTEPFRIGDEVAGRIRSGRRVEVVSPIYQAEFAESMPDSTDARLIVHDRVIERAIGDETGEIELRRYEETGSRIMPVDLALGVTEDSLMLSLPTLDGRYDSRAEVLAESDRAIQWGRDLFEHYWERATPESEFFADRP